MLLLLLFPKSQWSPLNTLINFIVHKYLRRQLGVASIWRVYIASFVFILAWAVEGLSCLDALECKAWTVDGCHVNGYGMMDQKLV